MPLLVLSRLSFAWSARVPLLSDASLELAAGWTGVVGPNGAGKTTLLRLAAGELAPDAGAVRLEPPGRRLLCAQRADVLEPGVLELAGRADRLAQRLRGRLALDPRELGRWSTLSPGERKRWQVGAALAVEPALLLLDEPTNHLDAPARELLAGALARFEGVGVVVSHDRELLDSITHATLRLRFGGLEHWRGGYSVARAAWESAERELRAAHARARGEERQLRTRLARVRARRDHAAAAGRIRHRRRNAGDNATHGSYRKSHRHTAEVALGREVGRVRRALARAEEAARELRFDRRLGRSLELGFEPPGRERLLVLERGDLFAGHRRLLSDVELCVRRGERIWVRGPNGAGKSTLLRALLGEARLPSSQLLYLPQELEPAAERALLGELRALGPEVRGRALGLVAALGVDPDALVASRAPSPGEARKLALAFGLARGVAAAVLDEPTNHLDLESIERFETALAPYPGALVLATHDAPFARRLTATTWELLGGRLSVLAGEGPA